MSSGTQPSSQSLAHRKGSDYYDLNNILFTQSVVPMTASTNIHGLGFLDPSGLDDEDLMAGAEMKLPLWLAEPLARKRIGALTIPKTHAKAIRHELRADAATVSMAQNQFIYEMGAVLATLTGDTELPTILASTFTARFAQLWDSARNWTTEDTATATATMCHSEKKLFYRGYESVTDYRSWSNRQQSGITAAPVIQSIARNRKRARTSD